MFYCDQSIMGYLYSTAFILIGTCNPPDYCILTGSKSIGLIPMAFGLFTIAPYCNKIQHASCWSL